MQVVFHWVINKIIFEIKVKKSKNNNLGPIMFLIAILIDIRVDAKRMLWIYKRPVAFRSQDIG